METKRSRRGGRLLVRMLSLFLVRHSVGEEGSRPEVRISPDAAATELAIRPRVRLRSVDSLRAIAALMVVLSHFPTRLSGEPFPLPLLKPFEAIGHTGVSLFLVISGFSIHLHWARKPEERERFSARLFWRRRFVRLYPTYYLATLLTVVALVLLYGRAKTFDPQVPWVVFPGHVPGVAQVVGQVGIVTANIVPVAFVGVAWSLALEEQLYAGYVLLMKRIRALRPVRVLEWAFAISILWRVGAECVTRSVPVGQFFDGGNATALSRVLYALPPARAFEWVLGLVAAEAFAGRLRLPRFTLRLEVGVCVLTLAVALFRYPLGGLQLNGNRFFMSDVLLDGLFGFGYFVIMNACIHAEECSTGWTARCVGALSRLGLTSYSIYLLHPAVIQVFIRYVPDTGASRVLGMGLLFCAILAVSAAFYCLVEKHFVRLAQRVRRTG